MNARLHRVSLSFHCAEQNSGRERVQPEAATTKNPDKAGFSVRSFSVRSNVSGSSVRTLGRHQHVRQPSVRQPSGGRYDCAQAAADSEDDCSALIRALRRLLCRAALFWWINPRADMRSRIGCAALSASRAASASLLLSAFTTFLTAVRSIERWATLRALRAMVCLARFCADLILATAWNLSGRCRRWVVARWIEELAYEELAYGIWPDRVRAKLRAKRIKAKWSRPKHTEVRCSDLAAWRLPITGRKQAKKYV